MFSIVRLELNLKLLEILSKNTRLSNLIKIRTVGAEMFHSVRGADSRTDGQPDRRTDMTKPKVDFRNFLNAPVNSSDVLPSLVKIGKTKVTFRRRA